MNRFTYTIRFRIMLATGACVVLMTAIGIFGAIGLSKLNSLLQDGYSGNTVPIIRLNEIRAAQLDARLQMRRIQVFHDAGKTATSVNAIRADLERIG